MVSPTQGRNYSWDYGIMVITGACLAQGRSSILRSLVRDSFSKCKLIKVLINDGND